jgi:hypothetical protein
MGRTLPPFSQLIEYERRQMGAVQTGPALSRSGDL